MKNKFISYQIGDKYGFMCFRGHSGRFTSRIKDMLLVDLLNQHFKVLNIIVLNDYPRNEVEYHCPGEGILKIVVNHTIATSEEVGNLYSMLYNKHGKKHCHIIGFNPIGEKDES